MDGDHNQVKRGTIQHEVVEGKKKLEVFKQDETIILQVVCKKEATKKLDEKIPYGLAVTLEAHEESNIPVYQRIKERLATQVQIEN